MKTVTKDIQSTNIRAAQHTHPDNQLVIWFHSEGAYQYEGVPFEVFEGLIKAGSAGQYFHRHIKSQFPFHKIAQETQKVA